MTWTGESREFGVSWCRRVGQCVGVSGSLFNRVHQLNRVVGGAVHPWASPGAAERIQDWVLGGRAADTDRRSFEASRPHALRSQQHTARGEPQERGAQRRRASVRSLPSKSTESALERGECAVHRRWRLSQGACGEKPPHAQRLPVCARPNPMRTRRAAGEARKEKSTPKGLTIAAT
jgi:hypothetical protein